MRRVLSRKGQAFRKESYKVFCPTFCTLQKVGKGRRRAAKGFNFVSANLQFCVLIRGSQNLGAPCEGERLVTFCIVQKVTKKHTGLRPATSIQSSAEKTFREASDSTSRTRFFAQNGGEKALNRCEIPVLQRKDLERTAKEWTCSLRTVGYGWVRMGDGGWKRGALEGNMEGLV